MKKNICSLIIAIIGFNSLCAIPRAVVFDFGGVMTAQSDRNAVIHFIGDKIQSSKSESRNKKTKKKKKNSSLDWECCFKSFIEDSIGINSEMYELVDDLKKKGVFIGVLSNIDYRSLQVFRNFGFFTPFEICLFSCELGVEKPNNRIYQILLESLNLPAEEIVFIDNVSENVEAAKKMRIDTILFESAKQVREELLQRGI